MMANDSLKNTLAPNTIDQLPFVNVVNMSSSRRVRKTGGTEDTSKRTQSEMEIRQHHPDQHVPNVQQGHPLPPPPPPPRGDPLRKGSIAEGVFSYQIQEVEPSDKHIGGSADVTTVGSN
jgi:hypothetical protein